MIDSLKQFHLLLFEAQSNLCGISWNRSAQDWIFQHLTNIADMAFVGVLPRDPVPVEAIACFGSNRSGI